MPSPKLIVRAGAEAAATLRERGFEPDAFSTMVGASGGPKWLALARMDRVLAKRFLAPRTKPLALVGSSIGSFRHACLAQRDPLAALDRLEEAYLAQVYETTPSPEEVTTQSLAILSTMLGETGIEEILSHPLLATHIVTVRSQATTQAASGPLLALGLGAAAIANAVNRSFLGAFFERVIFHSSATPSLGFGELPTSNVQLNPANLRDALGASGSIPLVMAPIPDPDGAPPGLYRDGGVLDYHFDFQFARPRGLTLYPHFFDRITPGWFDKGLAWRRPDATALRDTVLIAPSPAFIADLPGGAVPDRSDFQTMPTAERLEKWRLALKATEALADELEGLFEGPIPAERILDFE